MDTMDKLCTGKCGLLKPIDEFDQRVRVRTDETIATHVYGRCRACTRDADREKARKRREQMRLAELRAIYPRKNESDKGADTRGTAHQDLFLNKIAPTEPDRVNRYVSV